MDAKLSHPAEIAPKFTITLTHKVNSFQIQTCYIYKGAISVIPSNEISVCRTFPPAIRGTNPLIKSTSPLRQPINLTPWSNWTIKFSLSILCGDGDRSLEKVGQSLASLHTRPPTAIRKRSKCDRNSLLRCWEGAVGRFKTLVWCTKRDD